MSFDCEDGTIMILEMLYIFIKCEFESKELEELRLFAAHYTPYMAIGYIPGSTEEFHIYALLLDKKWETNQEGVVYPSILLESTADVEGCWRPLAPGRRSRSAGDEVTDVLFKQQKSFEDVFGDEPLYGNVVALVPLDDGSVRHYLLHDGRQIGVDIKTLLDLNPTIHRELAYPPLEHRITAIYDFHLHYLPYSTIPRVHQTATIEGPLKVRFITTVQTYEKYKHLVDKHKLKCVQAPLLHNLTAMLLCEE